MAVESESQAADTVGLPPLTCSVFSSFEELDVMRDEWDAFVERTGGDIYSTLDWCQTWWEFYGDGRRLEIVLVRQGEELVGIFPFFHEKQWLGGMPLHLVRLVGCDHSVTTCNVVIAEALEREVIAAWAGAQADDWDAIILSPLPGYEGRGREIAEAVGLAFPETSVEYRADCGPHIVFDLPASYEEFLGGLSRNERHNIRRHGKRIRHEYAVTVSENVKSSDVAKAFKRFLPLHQHLWEAKGKLGHFGDWPHSEVLHETLVKRLGNKGRVLMFELQANDKVVAVEYCFLYGSRMHWFLNGRKESEDFQKWNIGRMGFTNLVEWAIDHGYTSIDAMQGYYEYKLRLGGRLAHLQSIVATRRTARSRIAFRLFRAGSWLLHTAYYRLWFRKIAPFIGVKRGPLWKTWIRSGR